MLVFLASSSVYADNYNIGILAFEPKPIAKARWQPLATYLHQKIPQHTFHVLPMSYHGLNKAIHEGNIDFVYTNPGHYVELEHNGFVSRAMASQISEIDNKGYEEFGGLIFALANRDDISNLQSIAGKTIASVDKDSLGGFQMEAYELHRIGINFTDLKMLWTDMPHDKVVQKVIQHEADVGFIRTGVLERMVKAGTLELGQIKIINEQNNSEFPLHCSTQLYPEWPFAPLVSNDDNIVRSVAAALLLLPHEGVLARSMRIHGFNIAADYEPVRNILRQMQMPPYNIIPKYIWTSIWIDYSWYILFSVVIIFVIVVLLLRFEHLNKKLLYLTKELDKLSHIDGLTGIANRRYFDEQYTQELKRASRTHLPLTIIMIDIDFFKNYNDSYGHQQGDECLKSVSSVIRKELSRSTDTVCRYGGEEFVILLPATSGDDAMNVAESVRKEIMDLAMPHKDSKVSDVVTISLGVAASESGDNQLLMQADKALYQAKEYRNKACLHQP